MQFPLPITMQVPQSDYDALLGSLYTHKTVWADDVARRLRVSCAQIADIECIRFFVSEADAKRVVAEIAETLENRTCIRGMKRRLDEIEADRRAAEIVAAEAGEEEVAAGRSDREAA